MDDRTDEEKGEKVRLSVEDSHLLLNDDTAFIIQGGYFVLIPLQKEIKTTMKENKWCYFILMCWSVSVGYKKDGSPNVYTCIAYNLMIGYLKFAKNSLLQQIHFCYKKI